MLSVFPMGQNGVRYMVRFEYQKREYESVYEPGKYANDTTFIYRLPNYVVAHFKFGTVKKLDKLLAQELEGRY